LDNLLKNNVDVNALDKVISTVNFELSELKQAYA
jgi:hypothetical protein